LLLLEEKEGGATAANDVADVTCANDMKLPTAGAPLLTLDLGFLVPDMLLQKSAEGAAEEWSGRSAAAVEICNLTAMLKGLALLITSTRQHDDVLQCVTELLRQPAEAT
jgi:hypothetical protein